MVKLGQHVIYIDEHRQEHDAIVTAVFDSMGNLPGINCIYVSMDATREDPYGRQTERATSVVHIDAQPAKAVCWKEA